MRLIDADALIGKTIIGGRRNNKTIIRYIVTNIVQNAPTVDAVPVVRCKDCKWHDSGVTALGSTWDTCTVHINRTLNTWEDNYCGWAERRKDETN